MLKQRLTTDEIKDLALAVVNKYQPTSNTVEDICIEILNAYAQSIEYFKKQNEKYTEKNPPRARTL